MNRIVQASLFDLFTSSQRAKGVLDMAALDSMSVNKDAVKRLHVMLEARLGIVDLIFTDNRRRMVSLRPNRHRTEVRIHHMFIGCDDFTVDALRGLLKNEPSARETIREYIRVNSETIRGREEEVVAEGRHYDLDVLLKATFALIPEAPDTIRITWGRDGKGNRSIRLGSYAFDQKLIRIHPALDNSWVPDFFVEFVVYHEVLHALFPPSSSSRRRALHPPEFRRREREFPRYEEAIEWERANLHRFLNR